MWKYEMDDRGMHFKTPLKPLEWRRATPAMRLRKNGWLRADWFAHARQIGLTDDELRKYDPVAPRLADLSAFWPHFERDAKIPFDVYFNMLLGNYDKAQAKSQIGYMTKLGMGAKNMIAMSRHPMWFDDEINLLEPKPLYPRAFRYRHDLPHIARRTLHMLEAPNSHQAVIVGGYQIHFGQTVKDSFAAEIRRVRDKQGKKINRVVGVIVRSGRPPINQAAHWLLSIGCSYKNYEDTVELGYKLKSALSYHLLIHIPEMVRNPVEGFVRLED